MFRTKNWTPSDDQTVQLLINRGYIERDQVAFARLYQAIGGGASLLAILIEHGHVLRRDVNRVVLEAQEDEQLRQKARQYHLLDEQVLDTARSLQRGTRRTLMETLREERLCPNETLQALGRPGAPAPRLVAMPAERRGFPRTMGGSW